MRNWYIMHRSGKRLSVVAQQFKDFVVQEAKVVLDLPAIAQEE